jgi:glycosyltransferase involved in cell wall biosynthesis
MASRVVTLDQREEVIEHPWPFGRFEAEMLRRLTLERLSADPRPWVLWASDPKSAVVFARLQHIPSSRLVRVFDAYDAWDLSPLVRGRWRRHAVLDGYRAAARHSDVVFANTEFMARRMTALGARRVSLLQNGAPPVDPIGSPGRIRDLAQRPYLVYVGRIHERIDTGLLGAVADTFPEIAVRLIGPVEREPGGWSDLVARPNVGLEAPLVGERLRVVIRDAVALLVPHRVDDYTRSQDAMKAWDALAVGTPVVSTPLPPVDGWPTGMALVGADVDAFVACVRSVVRGGLDADREARLGFAAANGWDARASAAIAAIERVPGP